MTTIVPVRAISFCDPHVRCKTPGCLFDVPRRRGRIETIQDTTGTHARRCVGVATYPEDFEAAIARGICWGCEAATRTCPIHGTPMTIGYQGIQCDACEEPEESK